MPTILLSILFQEFKRLLHCSSPLTKNNISCPFLPPAYMVRTTGGYVFTGVCLFNFRGGGEPHPRSGQGGTTFRVWTGGGDIPHPRSRRGGYPQSQLDGVPPGQDWVGYPPSRPGMGYPPPSWLDEVPPPPPHLPTRLAVCLLRSRRRTFLLCLDFTPLLKDLAIYEVI